MLKPNPKIIVFSILAILVTSCRQAITPTLVEPTQLPDPIVVEKMPTETPIIERVPTGTVANEPIPTETKPTETETVPNTWKKIIGGSINETLQNVIIDKDGGYLILGSTNLNFDSEMTGDVYLLKTDADGEVLREETYGGDGYLLGQTLFQTSDGLLISGVKLSVDTQGEDIFILQLDLEQNEVWTQTFGGPLDEFGVAWPMRDGGYLLGGNLVDPSNIVTDPGAAGYGGFEGRSNVFLARVDADGNELWSRTYGGEDNVISSASVLAEDGGFVILANILYFPEPGDDILFFKVDENGNEVWSHRWDDGNLAGHDLIRTSDGNYLIAGSNSTGDDPANPSSDYLFIKVDPAGNEIWSVTFGDPDMLDYSKVIIETLDGGYVGAGEYTKDYYNSPSDISLVKLDSDGQLVWQNKIEMASHNMFGSILQNPDGSIVIGGSTVQQGQFDIFLIKMDANGNIE